MSHNLCSSGEKSTTTSLLKSTHNWLPLLESGRDVGAVFFKVAFNSVPHCTLIDKLKGINLDPVLLHWIQSYLSGRRQQEVMVNGDNNLYYSTDQLQVELILDCCNEMSWVLFLTGPWFDRNYLQI